MMRKYAVEKFEKIKSGKGQLFEKELYTHVCEKCPGKESWDFFQFRKEYKHTLSTLLENMKYSEMYQNDELFKNNLESLFKTESSLKPILNNSRNKDWTENLWVIPEEEQEEIIQREGQFSCGNCARKKVYSKNTSHEEKQTRSADEPMTIFVHCHTCGKNFKFSN